MLGPLLAVVGTGAVGWGLFARPEFGDLPTRFASLYDLLAQDRCLSISTVGGIFFLLFMAFNSIRVMSTSSLKLDDALFHVCRLGSSFVVDLVLFALFQGWLVDDDLRRRGIEPQDAGPLGSVAKFIPFWGLSAYLALRPSLPSRTNTKEHD